MTYQETLVFLYAQVPQYQKIGYKAFKANLNNIQKLCEYLNNPQNTFKSIHIAGTNGKGSTSHIITSILQEAGFKVGLYTSPHLKDFRERIKINGSNCSENFVVDFVNKIKPLFNEIQPSFFEITVAMAFEYFAQQKVDYAIVETGLGGRLDATNIVQPILSVITNVSLDHTQFLGDTIEEIAAEKGGIIKNNIPVVIGERQKVVEPIFRSIAQDKKSSIYFAEELLLDIYSTDLKGDFQYKNVRTALAAINILGLDFDKNLIKRGCSRVVENTNLIGRWQTIQNQPKVIVDIGHNIDGVKEIVKSLKTEIFNNLFLVLGFSNDKNIESVLPLFPKDAQFIFTQANIERAMSVEQIIPIANKLKLNYSTEQNVQGAYQKALNLATKEDLVFVGGSNFIVAEIIP